MQQWMDCIRLGHEALAQRSDQDPSKISPSRKKIDRKLRTQNNFQCSIAGDLKKTMKFLEENRNCTNERTICRRTALHVAALVGNLECWEFLIDSGMSYHDRDEFGLTPLNYVQINEFNHIREVLKLQHQFLKSLLKKKYEPERLDFDVIIIGAGAAGIGAARYIEENTSKSYVILEARSRVGGRIFGEKVGGVEQDFGASWIHNYCQENPFKKLVQKYKWPLEKNGMRPLEWFDADTLEYDSDTHFQAQMIFQKIVENGLMQAKKDHKHCSIWDSIKKEYQNLVQKGSNLERYVNYCKFYTEHYEAASIQQLDVFYDEYGSGHGGDATPLPSYCRFVETVSKSLNIRLNSIVTRIDYSKKPTVSLSNNVKLTAEKVIITLPLGVLKAKIVEMYPQLPASHLSSIQNLGFGLMNKIFLHYDKKFWKGQIRIISAENGRMPWFFDRSQGENYVLMGFITADYAKSLTFVEQDKVLQEAHEVLKKIYEQKCGNLLGGKITKWEKQEFSLGSYSHFKVGSDDEDCKRLAEPVENKLFFAGQHLYWKHIGTAYGAYITGQTAANKATGK